MDFNELLHDIEKLYGLELSSIKPGSNIVIESINIGEERINIRTKDNQIKTRPLAEIRKIWENLCVFPAVRVENALQGAGSSRNHPETILANLPYIEWLIIEGKKHICLVSKRTHPFGTLRKMEDFEAEFVRDNVRKNNEDINTNSQIIIVSSEISATATRIQNLLGKKFLLVEKSIYQLHLNSYKIILIAPEMIDLPPGSYSVIPCKNLENLTKPILLLGRTYFKCLDDEGLRILLLQL